MRVWARLKHLVGVHTWALAVQHNGPRHRRCIICHMFQTGSFNRARDRWEWANG